jgi:CARDB
VSRLLRNPLVLGGLAIVLAVVAAIVVAVLFSDGEEETVIATPPAETSTPGRTPTRTSVPLEGMSARALSTLTVRAGPGTGYISLGIARRDAELEVVGKNEEESWLAISYPPRSQLVGWVTADSVELEGSLASLPVATPESLVMPAVPTYAGGVYVDEEPDLTPTPEASALPDLIISDARLSGGGLVVTITNQGTADAAAPIDVTVYSGDGSTPLRLARIGESLPAGASVDLATQYETAEGPQRLLIRVDPANRVQEMSEDNNDVVFGVSGLPASPSPTAPRRSPTATATPRTVYPGFTRTPTVPASPPTETPTRPAPTPTPIPTAQATPEGGG